MTFELELRDPDGGTNVGKVAEQFFCRDGFQQRCGLHRLRPSGQPELELCFSPNV